MTPDEIILSDEQQAPVETPENEAAQALSDMLTDSASQQIPEEKTEPQPVAASPFDPIPAAPAAKPVEKPAKQPRRKPHIALRVLLQLLSFVVALALFGTTLAGALVLDLQQITSAGGIKQLINAAMSILTAAPAQTQQAQPHISGLSNWDIHYDEADTEPDVESWYVIFDENGNPIVVDENGNPIEGNFGDDIYLDENGNLVLGEDLEDLLNGGDLDIDLGEIPEDILNNAGDAEGLDSLIDWLYDQAEAAMGEELPISKEDVKTFIEESTVADFLSEKLADFAEDFINGTETVTITADEIMELLEENEEVLKEHLQIELTPDIKEEIRHSMESFVEESGINDIIRDDVFGAVNEMLEDTSEEIGVDVEEIRSALQLLTSDSMRNLVIVINVVLLLLLCLLNFYNVPAGLTWAAFPCMLSGAILSLPLVLMGGMTIEGDSGAIVDVLTSFVDSFKPIHYGLLFIGVGLLIVSVVWRAIRSVVRQK